MQNCFGKERLSDFTKKNVVVTCNDFVAGERLCLRCRGPRFIIWALSDYVFLVDDLGTGYAHRSTERVLISTTILASIGEQFCQMCYKAKRKFRSPVYFAWLITLIIVDLCASRVDEKDLNCQRTFMSCLKMSRRTCLSFSWGYFAVNLLLWPCCVRSLPCCASREGLYPLCGYRCRGQHCPEARSMFGKRTKSHSELFLKKAEI